MAYQNYVPGTFKKKRTALTDFADAVKSATGGKRITLTAGKKAVLYPATQGNMNRVTKQPAIKYQDPDSGRKGAQLQTDATSQDSGAIATKQKDNTVPASTATKFTPKVNQPAKAKQTTKGVTKSPNDMNYAKTAAKNVDGAGMKPQNHTGIGGASGSKKVAFASMKKGKTMPAKTAKVAGVTAVKQKNNNIAGAQSQGYNYKKG